MEKVCMFLFLFVICCCFFHPPRCYQANKAWISSLKHLDSTLARLA